MTENNVTVKKPCNVEKMAYCRITVFVQSSKSHHHTTTKQRLILPAARPPIQMNMAMAGSNIYQTLSSSADSTVAFLAPALNRSGGYNFVQMPVVSQVSIMLYKYAIYKYKYKYAKYK